MFRSKLMVSALSVVCLVSSQAVFASAAPRANSVPAHMSSSSKPVSFSVNNSSSEPLSVTVGDQAMTIEPGKTAKLSAMVGTKVVNVTETKTHKAGEVLIEVSKQLSDATLHIS